MQLFLQMHSLTLETKTFLFKYIYSMMKRLKDKIVIFNKLIGSTTVGTSNKHKQVLLFSTLNINRQH